MRWFSFLLISSMLLPNEECSIGTECKSYLVKIDFTKSLIQLGELGAI